MEARTVIDQIEVQAQTGNVGVRMLKQVVEGTTVLASGYHRLMLAPGTNVDEALAALAQHLASMGYPMLSAAEIDLLNATVQVVKDKKGWTWVDPVPPPVGG